MEYFLSLFVFAKAILFKLTKLNAKKFQEKWASPFWVLYYQRYAIFPWFILLCLSYKKEYVDLFLNNLYFMWIVALMLLFWVIQESITYFVLWKVSNMSYFTAFLKIISLPIYIFAWIYMNWDYPNYHIFFAFILLWLALFLKPSVHENNNQRNTFSMWIYAVISILLVWTILDAINNWFDRFILQHLSWVLFWVGINTFLISLVLSIIFLFKDIPKKDKIIASKYKYIAYSIPVFWFLGSIPEWYSYAEIPIYTVLAISSVGFLMDIISDVKNERLHFNMKTIIFIVLVFLSIGLSILSLK